MFVDIQDKRLPLKNFLSITVWVEDNGLSLADFEKEWNSNEVKNIHTKLVNTRKLTAANEVLKRETDSVKNKSCFFSRIPRGRDDD